MKPSKFGSDKWATSVDDESTLSFCMWLAVNAPTTPAFVLPPTWMYNWPSSPNSNPFTAWSWSDTGKPVTTSSSTSKLAPEIRLTLPLTANPDELFVSPWNVKQCETYTVGVALVSMGSNVRPNITRSRSFSKSLMTDDTIVSVTLYWPFSVSL